MPGGDVCGQWGREHLRIPALAGRRSAGPRRCPGLNSTSHGWQRAADAAGCAAGYLIGSVPFGLIVGKAVGGLDVRDFGSGNMGTANVLRTVGARAGAITFGLDVAKGAAAVAVARKLGADPAAQAAAGLAACVGHSWPVFARFRGGKAVATAFGGLLMVSPQAAAWATAGGAAALSPSPNHVRGLADRRWHGDLWGGPREQPPSRRRCPLSSPRSLRPSSCCAMRRTSGGSRAVRSPSFRARCWGGRH